MTDTRLPRARAMIGQWALDRYERLLSPQLVVSPLLFVGALLQWPNVLLVVLESLWAVTIGIIISRRRGGPTESLTAGAVAGLFSGLAVSLGRWVVIPSATWGANVVAETLVTAVTGALLSTVAMIIDRRWRITPKN